MKKWMIVLVLCLVGSGVQAGVLPVVASIEPVAYVVEQVGGDLVEVSVMVPPGKSPATYQPTPAQVVALSQAVAFFSVGVPFERAFLERIREVVPQLLISDCSAGVVRRYLGEHGHDDVHESSHADPHIWLNPLSLCQMASNITQVLCEELPEHRGELERRCETLCVRMRAFNERVSRMLQPYRGRVFYVYHPAFGYFADAYGLHQEAIEQAGKSPQPRELAKLIATMRNEHAEVLFVQPQFDQRQADVIARSVHARVERLDALSFDVPANILHIATVLQQVYEGIP